MIINVLTNVQSDTYILQIITQQELQQLRQILQKDLKFSKNITDTCKVENKNSICISVFDYENKGKYQIYVLKKRYEKKNMLIYY